MKFLYLKTVVLSFLVLFSQNINAQDVCRELVWSDEFNRNGAPSTENWTYDLGTGDGGWGNREIQIYTSQSENVRQENGSLIIDAIKGSSNQWTSARVKSQGLQSFAFGVIEFRAKLPTGSGTWPALWLLGEDITQVGWPRCGEIDVMEHVGKDPGRIHGSLHSPSSFGNTVNTGSTIINTFDSEFHIYTAEWTPDRIIFSVDGRAYYTYAPSPKNADNWPFDDEFFLIMNIAMGGNFGSDPQYETGGLRNGVDPNLSQARMEVDYVRVYQEIEGALTISGDSTIMPGEQNVIYTVSGFNGEITWTVPQGATIVSGQGSNRIRVNWGEVAGPITATAVGNCGEYVGTLNVQQSIVPEGNTIVFDDFEDGVYDDKWSLDVGNGNTYTLREENGELMVAYEVTDPGENPRLILDMGQAVDVGNFPLMRVRARTRNTNRTVVMRIDLRDANGVETNESPVFRLEPIIDDGEHHDYEFDFTGQYISSSPIAGAPVDSEAITGLSLYINYGFFGTPGVDTVWFEFIEMINPNATAVEELQPGDPVEIYPNPVSHELIIERKSEHAVLDIEVFNTAGQRLIIDQLGNFQNRKVLNTDQLIPGIYFMKIRAGKQVYSKRIIKR